MRFIEGPANTWTLQIQIAQRRMITALEKIPDGWGGEPDRPNEEGFLIWDLADPESPRILGHYRTGGDGTHRNYYDGGRYVHTTALPKGYDGHIYQIVDIADPEKPTEISRWWHRRHKSRLSCLALPNRGHGQLPRIVLRSLAPLGRRQSRRHRRLPRIAQGGARLRARQARRRDAKKTQITYLGLPAEVVATLPLATYTLTVEPSQVAFWVDVCREFGMIKTAISAADLVVK